MISYNYDTGEPIVGSPEITSQDDSDQFAVKAQDLYRYQANPYFTVNNPNQRSGYTIPNNQYGPTANFMNPPEPQYNLQNSLSYMNPNQTTNMGYGYQGPQFQGFGMVPPGVYPSPIQQPIGYAGNPAFQLMSQWQQQGYQSSSPYYQNQFQRTPFQQPQQVQYQDQTIHVPGYNPTGSEGMLRADAEEVCNQLQVDMMYEQEAAKARREERMQGWFNNNAYGYNNYYGVPYYQNQYDYNIVLKYRQKLEQMKQEAILRRRNFNKNLSRLVHNYLDDGVTEEQINNLYDGYSYTIPGAQIKSYSHQDYLSNLKEFNNASYYQEYDKKVTEFFRYMSPAGRNLNEFLNDCGFIKTVYRLEDEMHKRRDAKQYYDSDTYHRFMRKFALENNIKDMDLFNNSPKTREQILTSVFGESTLKDIQNLEKNLGTKVDEDGRVIISASEEMKQRLDPGYISPITPVVVNQAESDYEKNRSIFLNSIYQAANSGG